MSAKFRVASLALMFLFQPIIAGPGEPVCAAADHLEDYFMLKAAPAWHNGECPVLTALSATTDILGERDFPNSQARVEPLKPRNYEKAAKLSLKGLAADPKKRAVACRVLIDIAGKTDETMVHHAIEMIVLIDDAKGTCTKQLGHALRPDQKPAELFPYAAELCRSRKEPHCADLEALSRK